MALHRVLGERFAIDGLDRQPGVPTGRNAGRTIARAHAPVVLRRVDRRRRGLRRRGVTADRRGVVDRRRMSGRRVAERRGWLVGEVAGDVTPTSLPPSYGSRSIVASSLGCRVGHRPRHVGGRFSWNARMPSRWSSVANRSKNASRSARRPALSGARPPPARTVWRHARRAAAWRRSGRPGRAPRRPRRRPARRSSRDPAASASAAGIVRPVSTSSIARATRSHASAAASRPRPA